MTLSLVFDTVSEENAFLLLSPEWQEYHCFSDATQSDQLPFMLERILADKGCVPQQISKIVFNRGPGSFTGIKIGYVIAQGLGLESTAEVLSYTTFDRMYLASGNEQATYVLNAFQDDIFCAKRFCGDWTYRIDKRSFLYSKEAENISFVCFGESFHSDTQFNVIMELGADNLSDILNYSGCSIDTSPFFLKKSTAEIKAQQSKCALCAMPFGK